VNNFSKNTKTIKMNRINNTTIINKHEELQKFRNEYRTFHNMTIQEANKRWAEMEEFCETHGIDSDLIIVDQQTFNLSKPYII
jgi:hypothetical protein